MNHKVKLFVAGVVHEDPLGRPRVQRWLRKLLLRESQPPTFVAVEWDKDDLARIVSRRPYLAKLAKVQWPDATKEFIEALAYAAGYEGDSHIQILPLVKTVWLDEGRKRDEEKVKNFAEDRMVQYKYLARDLKKFDGEGLEDMSRAAWNSVSSREKDPKRDEKFAKRLSDECGTSTSNWAIAILGADHIADSPRSAIGILIKKGISCDATNMAPVQ